jgi:hypothetical protein
LSAGSWSFLLGGGLRYVHLSQRYNAYTSSHIAGEEESSTVADTLLSGTSFNGWGPVGSLEVRRVLGDGGLALYGKVRGSVLFGSSNQSAFRSEVETFSDGDVEVTNSNGFINRSIVMSTIEGELGVEFRRSQMFGQIGLVAQEWFNAGNASRSYPNDATNNDLGFFGLVFRVGMNF